MLSNVTRFLQALVFALLLPGIDASKAADGRADAPIEIDAANPSDYWLAAVAAGLLPSEPVNGLAQIASYNIGWFDYDIMIDRTGWYRLSAEAKPHLGNTEFLFDLANAAGATRLVGSMQLENGRFHVGWVWLVSGAHRLRVQNFHWTGLPQIKLMHLKSPPEVHALRITQPKKTAFAIGACEPLTFETGGNAVSFVVDAVFRSGGRVLTQWQMTITPSRGLTQHSLHLPCERAGDVSVELRAREVRADLDVDSHIEYAVFDTSPVEPAYRRGRLAIDIDAANRQPDFRVGDTSVIVGSAGNYRSSGEHGSTPFIRRQGALRRLAFGILDFFGISQSDLPNWFGLPNWFAYRVDGLLPNQPYILEIEYPDDAPRVFVVALRDSKGRGYPTSIGAETGVIWPTSGRMAKMSAIVWPSSSDGRVIVINIHDGMRAAVGHIRFYEAISQETKPATPRATGRDMAFWYEEGDNFRDLVGEGHEPAAVFTPVDRYLRLARSSGATIVSPTVVVYNFAMYPSRFHLAFGDRDRDMTAAFMLGAERYGLKIVPQLHPRADELLWPPRDQASLEKRLLLSADGQHHLLRRDGDIFRPPFYNPLNADVRSWYVDMIGELADRYKDYPAFAGIDLRVSDWQNPALNNLVSLDWGYEAETVARFFHETGLTPPAGLDVSTDMPEAARRRHDDLVGKHRAAWIAWRCGKIRDLYQDIVLRVRSARPDLRLLVSIFGDRWSPEAMREFGIDIDLLNAIDGLTLIDERFAHGAREADTALRRSHHADLMLAENFSPFAGLESRPNILLPMEYVEITPGKVVPAKAIGLPEPPREPWISSATEPPGRLALARFATTVGLADPFMLGDGGNGYVFGDETLREFMAEFRSLPRRAFERVLGAPDAMVVRQRDGIFYVVNMLGMPVKTRLRLDAPATVTRTTSSQIVTASDGFLPLDLLPYQMLAFRTGAGHRVLGAEVRLSREAQLDFVARVTASKKSTDALCEGSEVTKKCAGSRARLQSIEAAITRGDYWTAERLMEPSD
jgi:hypothetical protein